MADYSFVNTNGQYYIPDLGGDLPLPAFSGSDIISVFVINNVPYVQMNIQTISIDVQRNLTPVPTFGKAQVTKFSRGHRVIAGTIVFLTTINGPLPISGPCTTYPLKQESTIHKTDYFNDEYYDDKYGVNLDNIPPFNVVFSYMDEYGRQSVESLYGVTLYKSAKILSVQDLVTAVECQYFAAGISPQLERDTTHKYEEARLNGEKNMSYAVLFNNISNIQNERRLLLQMQGLDTIPDFYYKDMTAEGMFKESRQHTGTQSEKMDTIRKLMIDYDNAIQNNKNVGSSLYADFND